MRQIVFLLEELSARYFLEGLLPKLLPESIQVKYLVFEGKQDLEGQLIRKLRGWRTPDSAFVILRDQDSADYEKVKEKLSCLALQSGRTPFVVEVACRELESWIVGDWYALSQAFENPTLLTQSNKALSRNPDELANPVEIIRRHIPDYQKVDGARRVGPFLKKERNKSASFHAFCAGVLKLFSENI